MTFQSRLPPFEHRLGNTSPESRSRQSWTSDWGNWVVAGLIVYVAIFVGWLFFASPGELALRVAGNLAFPPVMALGALFAWRVALQSGISSRSKRGWILIGIGMLCWMAGDLVWAIFEITGISAPYPSVADAFYLAMYPFWFIGLWFFAVRRFEKSERIRYGLDAGTILAGFAGLLWLFIVRPNVEAGGVRLLDVTLWTLYPTLNLVVLLIVFSIVQRLGSSKNHRGPALFSAGIGIMLVTNIWWGHLESQGQYLSDAWTYSLWMIAQAMIVAAPQLSFDGVRRRTLSERVASFANFSDKVMPYGAAALAYAVLLFAVMPDSTSQLLTPVLLTIGLTGLIAVRHAVTLRQNADYQAAELVRRTEERFARMVEHSSDMITLVDRDFVVRYQSPSSVQIMGHDPDDVIGTDLLDWIAGPDREKVARRLEAAVAGSSNPAPLIWRGTRAGGATSILETMVSNQLDNPSVDGLVLNTRDVTERQRLEERLHEQAYSDSLTGLPNRMMFMERLNVALLGATPDRQVAVLFFDVDHFKSVNDAYGHDVGDELLSAIGVRIRRSLRPADILARLAGDEFTALLEDLNGPEHAVLVANRMLEGLEQPLEYGDVEGVQSVSIGIAITGTRETDPGTLLRQADLAMYMVKRGGRGRVAVFEPWMERDMSDSAFLPFRTC